MQRSQTLYRPRRNLLAQQLMACAALRVQAFRVSRRLKTSAFSGAASRSVGGGRDEFAAPHISPFSLFAMNLNVPSGERVPDGRTGLRHQTERIVRPGFAGV